jgi:hypothetical protein
MREMNVAIVIAALCGTAALVSGQTSPLGSDVALVRRIPRSPTNALKSCYATTFANVAFCVLTTSADDLLGVGSGTGFFFESMYRAVKLRKDAPLEYAAVLRVAKRSSLIAIQGTGRPVYTPGGEQNLFRLPDGQSEIIGLGEATRIRPGIAACVRTPRELSQETGKLLWRQLRALLGPTMTELRLRNDGWFLDEEFSLGPLTLCARNDSLPTRAELDARIWLLCSGSDEPNCVRFEGVRYRKPAN